jgi:hypothetical protein
MCIELPNRTVSSNVGESPVAKTCIILQSSPIMAG